MNLSHINNIKRSDLDKHIHIKKFYLLKKIPNKDLVDYILRIVTENDKLWVDLGYKIANIKYLWIDNYFSIILKNYGLSEYITRLLNKIDYDYIEIKSQLDTVVCDIYNEYDYLPEYPKIKITKIFYNLLDIKKTYTSQIKGIYPKKLNNQEKINILEFITLNRKLIEDIDNYINNKIYINYLNKHLNKLELFTTSIDSIIDMES
tara:strand:+ start:1172 stop:1786 length:615 start_codon:yes stop_codon:yes gene_type:complete